ncbi:P-loop containing nucleoside triphosphate hydrolase protein [Mycena sp. CBHHK59/15]|nr:P-loop containing nucleoside triphosphate hydrolase protein [Mycena sp. CBHHK59/15]
MASLISALLSRWSFSPPELSTQFCKCRPLYPDLSSKLADSCHICGFPKISGEKSTTNQQPENPSSRSPAPNQSSNLPHVEPPGPKAVRYLNRKLTESFASIPDIPVLICRNGAVAVFADGMLLHAYQAMDLQRMCDREAESISTGKGSGYILGYDMGLGKTVTSIALICSRRSPTRDAFPTTLVVAPSVGILQHWKSEVQKFAPKMRVLLYHKEGRNEDPRVPDVTLVTLAQVRAQYAAYKDEDIVDERRFPLYTGRWHRVVIDEAHTIRNPDTASAAACWALQKSHGLCLIGTPAQNKLRDLFPLFKFLDVTSHGLNNLATFDRSITTPYERGEIVRTTKLLVDVLRDCMIYRPKDSGHGVVPLPTRHADIVVRVALTPSERATYDYMAHRHQCKSSWTRVVRTRQVADSPVLLTKALHSGDIGPKPDETSDEMRFRLDQSRAEPQDVIAQDIPLDTCALPPCLQEHAAVFRPGYVSSKFLALWKILRAIPAGEKVMIFSHFLTTLDLVADMLSKKGISYVRYDGRMGANERGEALDQVKDDKESTVLLVSIMAGGIGLNIPACNHVVLVEPWWNPHVEDQAIARAHRIGQRREVWVYKLLVEDSIEDSIVKVCIDSPRF